MRVFFHLIDFTICNAWLLYQLEHSKTFPGKKYLDLYDFKRYVSECWMSQNECTAYRRLRKSEGRSEVPRPVRFDGVGHWPDCTNGYHDRKRCAHCKRSTNMYCTKCKVHLCCHQRRNCFKPFHTVDKGNIINFNYADSDQSDQESDADELESEENAHSDFSESC